MLALQERYQGLEIAEVFCAVPARTDMFPFVVFEDLIRERDSFCVRHEDWSRVELEQRIVLLDNS